MRPIIATERLLLRPLELEDAPRLSELSSNPSVALRLARVPLPNPVVAVEGWILILKARAPLQRDFAYAIERAGEGVVGTVGVHGTPGAPFELGYWLGQPFWGRGYASEAARAAAQEAGAQFGPLAAWRQVDNHASGRVLEKAGFAPTGREEMRFSLARGKKVPCVHLARAAPALQAA